MKAYSITPENHNQFFDSIARFFGWSAMINPDPNPLKQGSLMLGGSGVVDTLPPPVQSTQGLGGHSLGGTGADGLDGAGQQDSNRQGPSSGEIRVVDPLGQSTNKNYQGLLHFISKSNLENSSRIKG